MSTTSGNVLDTVVQGVCQATAANLKFQQEMLSGWSRLWPGFTGRLPDPPDSARGFRQLWSDNLKSVVRTQRDLFDQQFNAAINLFDTAMGVGTPSQSAPPPAEKPVRSAAKQPARPAEPKVVATPAAATPAPEQREVPTIPVGVARNIHHKVAVVTGAASGIGEAVARELANRGARAVLLVDRSDAVGELAEAINKSLGRTVAIAKAGDTTDQAFRKRVFSEAADQLGLITICVPAAGITRDGLAVRVDKETGRAQIYPVETFRQVTEVNLLAPIYWGIEMVAQIAEDRRRRGLGRWEPEEQIQGAIVFLGSVSSQGNKGQISYAVTKAGLEGGAATLQKEAMFHGVRCGIIHPGFTDTPMARALGEEYLKKNVLPYTQLRRLIRPDEIADAVCFMISNSAVSGELWADAGWHPSA